MDYDVWHWIYVSKTLTLRYRFFSVGVSLPHKLDCILLIWFKPILNFFIPTVNYYANGGFDNKNTQKIILKIETPVFTTKEPFQVIMDCTLTKMIFFINRISSYSYSKNERVNSVLGQKLLILQIYFILKIINWPDGGDSNPRPFGFIFSKVTSNCILAFTSIQLLFYFECYIANLSQAAKRANFFMFQRIHTFQYAWSRIHR
jgi:hypothetical protein